MTIKQPIKLKLSFRWVLSLAFLLALLAEAYLGYSYIYSSYFSETPQLPEDSVVRVNIKSYQAAIGHLESLYNYDPGTPNLPRPNPFR